MDSRFREGFSAEGFGNDFREQRLEHKVILITDQVNFYGALSFRPAPQLQGRRDSRKAATEDHDASGTDVHSLPLRDHFGMHAVPRCPDH